MGGVRQAAVLGSFGCLLRKEQEHLQGRCRSSVASLSWRTESRKSSCDRHEGSDAMLETLYNRRWSVLLNGGGEVPEVIEGVIVKVKT